MAITFASIGCGKQNHSSNKLNEFDRAYIEEFRRKDFVNLELGQFGGQTGQTENLNPYLVAFKQEQNQQKQLLEHKMKMKGTDQGMSCLRRFLILFVSAGLVLTAVILFSQYVHHDHYVQYFTLLIASLLVLFILIVTTTRAYRQSKPAANSTPSTTTKNMPQNNINQF